MQCLLSVSWIFIPNLAFRTGHMIGLTLCSPVYALIVNNNNNNNNIVVAGSLMAWHRKACVTS